MNTEQAYEAFEQWKWDQGFAGPLDGTRERELKLAFIGGVVAQLKEEQRILMDRIAKK